jgi:hypothetical protein
MFKVSFESEMKKVVKDIERGQLKQRRAGALHLKQKIKLKTDSRKKTGNLSKGVYMHTGANESHVGIHAPGHQAFILEFGQGRLHKPAPSVYNTFAEEAGEVERIMSEPVL